MFLEWFVGRYNYIFCIILILIGLYGVIAKRNLIKKVIGLTVFQTAIILFFISIGVKQDATIPIILENTANTLISQPQLYVNPLPHVLMLTAIVVMVSTSGVALALIIMIYKRYQTLEEDEIVETL
ncbi:MAG: cation:proton antiporter subunit C [Planctomycetota bacterium]|nr:cation:proton antiporter subunit C [Planctomycetota bacterium]